MDERQGQKERMGDNFDADLRAQIMKGLLVKTKGLWFLPSARRRHKIMLNRRET